MQTDSQLFIVGSGSGADLAAATVAARRSALQQFASYARLQLRSTAAGGGLDPYAVGSDAEVVAEALENSGVPLPLLNEAQSAERTYRGQHEVVAQFVADRSAVSSYVEGFADVATFRGLTVAPVPPWSTRSGARLVQTPSWWAVPLGSTIASVNGVAVSTPGGFAATAGDAYETLEAGASFPITFVTPMGEEQSISVSKREEGPAPRPTLMKMDNR